MARRGAAPAGGKKKKRRKKKKLRLTLKSRSIKKADKYTESVGWSTNVKVLEDAQSDTPKEPEKIRHQCALCGSMMMIPKPKRAKYTITCPSCEHTENFS